MKFKEYMERLHASGYTGTDDEMFENYNDWMGELTPDEWIELAQTWSDSQMAKVKAIVM